MTENNRNISIDRNVESSVIISGNGNVVNVNSPQGNGSKESLPGPSSSSSNSESSKISSGKPCVFLCHAKEDVKAVRNLYDKLKHAGFAPWLDEENILGGQNPDLEIRQTMVQVDFVLVCLSKISVQKRGYVNKEIKWALDRQDEMLPGDIFTIPVKLEACELPFHLREMFPVDLHEPDGFEKLVKALKHQWQKTHGGDEETVCKISGSNPFHVGGAVPPKMFYGRTDVLNAISSRISGASPQSVSIVGERRMGKSSLLCYVSRELVKQLSGGEHSYLIIYLDLMRAYCHTRKGLMRVLRKKLSRAWRAPWEKYEDGDLEAFDFALEELNDENIRLVLCLDEMENLTRRPEEFDDLLEDWRACGSMGDMTMITASARPLADLCSEHKLISPFFNIFTTYYLGLFETEEWHQLIKDNMPVTDEELLFIEEMAGGHPLFTQMAASCLWEMKSKGSVDYGDLKMALVHGMQPHLEYLWEKLGDAEKSALRYCVGKTSVKPKDNILNDLNLRGILKEEKPFCLPFAECVSGH